MHFKLKGYKVTVKMAVAGTYCCLSNEFFQLISLKTFHVLKAFLSYIYFNRILIDK